MTKVKLGIIGMGNMGTTHSLNVANGKTPEIELVAVADRRSERRDFAKEKFGDSITIYEEGSDLIQNADVDAVIIAVPHYQHPTLSIEAFEKGINVVCEKPAGVYTKAVREMNAAADKSGKVFAMMFNQRTNPYYIRMKEIMDSGELGELRRVSWIVTDWFRTQSYYDSGAWRATWAGEGGGVLLNQCPHNLDLLQWLCGMPCKVTSFMTEGKYHDIEVEDDVTTFLEYPNGATGTFITTTGDAPGTNRLEITCDGGKLVCENGKVTLTKLKTPLSEFLKTSKEGFATPEKEVIDVNVEGECLEHVAVMNAFTANVLRGEPLVADGREGINGLTLSNAMHLSAWTNSTVTIPFDEDLYLKLLNEKIANSKLEKKVNEVTFTTEGTYGN